jgi:hypothetical protein
MSSVGAMSELASANREASSQTKKESRLTAMACHPLALKKKRGKEGGHGIKQLRDSHQETGGGEPPPREQVPSPKKGRGTPLRLDLDLLHKRSHGMSASLAGKKKGKRGVERVATK